MRRIARALISVALVATLAGAGLVTASTAAGASSPDEEAQFVAKINDLRASKGLPPMTPDAALAATACTWNEQMIAAGQISHDPNLATEIESAVPNWSKGGENVGMGGTIDSLFDAFVASPGHYKNLVDPDFSIIGVCVGRDASNKLFTTHRFVAVRGAPASPPPPPPTTAAATTPPPTTSAATAPPTTGAPPTTAPPATPAPTAAPTTAAPRATAPPTTAAPTTPAPAASPPPTPAPTTAALATTAATAAGASSSSTSGADSTTTPPEETVRELLTQIIDLFPEFLHLRLP